MARGRSKSHEIRAMVAIVSAKADWTLPVLRHKSTKNTPFYELDTETGRIMTNIKILNENSLLFAKEVFFEGNVDIEMMNRQFINHYGCTLTSTFPAYNLQQYLEHIPNISIV